MVHPGTLAEQVVVSTGTSELLILRLPSEEFRVRGVLVSHNATSQSPVNASVFVRVRRRGTADTIKLPLGQAWIRSSSVDATDGSHFFPLDISSEALLSIEITIRDDSSENVSTINAVVVV